LRNGPVGPMLSDMDSSMKFCHWLDCDREPVQGGYLCEAHLAKVITGRKGLVTFTTEILLGLGIGVASSALYQAIIAVSDRIAGDPAWAPMYRLRELAYALRRDNAELQEVARQLVENHGAWIEQELVDQMCRFIVVPSERPYA
jgi:hypothetical protein